MARNMFEVIAAVTFVIAGARTSAGCSALMTLKSGRRRWARTMWEGVPFPLPKL
jgi:hypothetical protein